MAPNGRKDARANRKPEPPTSSMMKTSESSGPPAELKSSPRLSHGISTSFNGRDGAQGASGLESSPRVSAASEETHGGGENAAEDASGTRGELDCSGRGGRPGRTPAEGGGDQRKSEEESRDESSLR